MDSLFSQIKCNPFDKHTTFTRKQQFLIPNLVKGEDPQSKIHGRYYTSGLRRRPNFWVWAAADAIEYLLMNKINSYCESSCGRSDLRSKFSYHQVCLLISC